MRLGALVRHLRVRLLRDPERLILSEHAGQAPSGGERACVFAHFDPAGRIEDYVVLHVRKLAELGLEVVFVSSADGLSGAEIAKVLPHCSRVVVRQNFGLDFGSWKTGIARIGDPGRLRQLVLANDSVFGPLRDLRPIFAQMEARKLDLWGLTESLELGRHLQSYFLVFEQGALASPYFREFWGGVGFHLRKSSIIRRGEVGLSQGALRRGWKIGAFIDGVAVRDAARREPGFEYPDRIDTPGFNLTLFAWDLLIRDFGFPCLKTEILRQNRFRSGRVAGWRELLGRGGCDYDPELIAQSRSRYPA